MQWVLMPFRRLTDTGGRSRRTEFWLFWLVALTIQMLASYVDAVGGRPVVAAGMGWTTLVTTLVFLVPAATVGIRRLHDIDRSGWWMLLIGLPYAGWLASVQRDAQTIPAAIALLLGSIILLVLLVQPGSPGDNRYGPSPKMSGNDGIADARGPH
jgi:uncharacterized membrane protein YhaH (DUF805 family)